MFMNISKVPINNEETKPLSDDYKCPNEQHEWKTDKCTLVCSTCSKCKCECYFMRTKRNGETSTCWNYVCNNYCTEECLTCDNCICMCFCIYRESLEGFLATGVLNNRTLNNIRMRFRYKLLIFFTF